MFCNNHVRKKIYGYVQPQGIELELTFPDLLIFRACNISHPYFQTLWLHCYSPCSELVRKGYWRWLENKSWSTILHDRVHSSHKFWSTASTTRERKRLISGKKMLFLVTLGCRNINCGVQLQINSKMWCQQRSASSIWAFSANPNIYILKLPSFTFLQIS